jgi:hypothetical protein
VHEAVRPVGYSFAASEDSCDFTDNFSVAVKEFAVIVCMYDCFLNLDTINGLDGSKQVETVLFVGKVM